MSCCETVEGRQKAATPHVHGFISKHRWQSGGRGRRLRCMCVELLCVPTHLISAECNFPSAHLPLVADEISVTVEQICIVKTSGIVRGTVLPKEITTSSLYLQTPKGSSSAWGKIHLLTLR